MSNGQEIKTLEQSVRHRRNAKFLIDFAIAASCGAAAGFLTFAGVHFRDQSETYEEKYRISASSADLIEAEKDKNISIAIGASAFVYVLARSRTNRKSNDNEVPEDKTVRNGAMQVWRRRDLILWRGIKVMRKEDYDTRFEKDPEISTALYLAGSGVMLHEDSETYQAFGQEGTFLVFKGQSYESLKSMDRSELDFELVKPEVFFDEYVDEDGIGINFIRYPQFAQHQPLMSHRHLRMS